MLGIKIGLLADMLRLLTKDLRSVLFVVELDAQFLMELDCELTSFAVIEQLVVFSQHINGETDSLTNICTSSAVLLISNECSSQ